MTSQGLGEVFKGDSADMSAGKFPLVSMGGQANGQACADAERGPPSARAEIIQLQLCSAHDSPTHMWACSHTQEKKLKNPPSLPQILFFCDLKLYAEFHNPRITPFGSKVCHRERHNPKNRGQFVPQ